MEQEVKLNTRHKALHINLNHKIYGSFAEIGAGQEVARQFFRAGGASGTIARSLSAYDMQESDAIYGVEKSGRYVARPRLDSMLETEFTLTVERIKSHRPPDTTFFAFANTVAAKAYNSDRDCHGWLGIKFQHTAGAAPSKIVMHVRMLDIVNKDQQAALGILGVNLIYGAFNFWNNPPELIDSLFEDLNINRIEVNYIDFSGPAFEKVRNSAMNIRLVTSQLGSVTMFGQNGKPIDPAELLYKKHVVVLRGTFRPFLDLHADMIARGMAAFAQSMEINAADIACICEMNVSKYIADGSDDISDMEERITRITHLGFNVMVSSFYRYFRLSEYFTIHDPNRKVGFVLSVENILTILNEKYYAGMQGSGGMLEAMGKLFASNAQLMVYPNMTGDGAVVTAETVIVPDKQKFLYKHLLYNKRVVSLHPNFECLTPLPVR
ncbi:MAG: TonB-dependent receptor [Deltaproteobacteria bacterium]|nr:TonB-dependent receptor [Deltaproteobacteria bacterium]MBN2674618.1 TonB-dependent receptor [Deltaproteobacteria bacterium]